MTVVAGVTLSNASLDQILAFKISNLQNLKKIQRMKFLACKLLIEKLFRRSF
jgi:hypothetical protein